MSFLLAEQPEYMDTLSIEERWSDMGSNIGISCLYLCLFMSTQRHSCRQPYGSAIADKPQKN